ncbi:S41 family peptidase [Polaribacter uvawellassae]|uniref:S41 family peptidase n=1 Tax=Polaribacter uvawellassae TaxID=3133495 RepID=UPI003219B540
MKNLYKILLLICISFTLYNCTKIDEIPADVEINDFVWKAMNAYYLYQDQIPDLADRRFNNQQELNSFLREFASPNELFLNLIYDRPNTDNKSVLLDDYNLIEQPSLRTSTTHGVEYGIIAEPGSADNVFGYVQYILPNSDASTKSIARGNFFYAVDNVQLTRDNYSTLLEGANSTFELSMADFDGTTVTPNAIKVSLTKVGYTHNPIFMSKNIASQGNNIGYLLYNNDFSSNYINDLNATFLQFKNQGVNELILDLRYNVGGGSFVKNITQIASMITGQFKSQPLIKKRWNSKAQAWFEQHQADSLLTKFTDKINTSTPINSLGLTDVYIILNGSSSSVELLINSLNSYMNVHVINSETTNGDNTGSITLYNSIDYDFTDKNTNHTVALQPIVLEFLNSNDETYADGFTPELRICNEENILNLGVLGDASDPLLNEVINLVNGIPPNPPSICNPNNLTFLYSSVRNQQIVDTGIFIHQDLPNTN